MSSHLESKGCSFVSQADCVDLLDRTIFRKEYYILYLYNKHCHSLYVHIGIYCAKVCMHKAIHLLLLQYALNKDITLINQTLTSTSRALWTYEFMQSLSGWMSEWLTRSSTNSCPVYHWMMSKRSNFFTSLSCFYVAESRFFCLYPQ